MPSADHRIRARLFSPARSRRPAELHRTALDGPDLFHPCSPRIPFDFCVWAGYNCLSSVNWIRFILHTADELAFAQLAAVERFEICRVDAGSDLDRALSALSLDHN